MNASPFWVPSKVDWRDRAALRVGGQASKQADHSPERHAVRATCIRTTGPIRVDASQPGVGPRLADMGD